MIAVLAAVLLAGGCRPQGVAEPSPNAVSSIELVERPKEYDGKTIDFQGEAIGEVMVRGDHAWIHLNDDAYYAENVEEGAALGGFNSGMAVWLPTELAERIGLYGDYKHEGDIVEVTGTFNPACAIHGGDMDIHATSLKVVVPGHDVVDPVHPGKVFWAFGLAILAGALFAAERLVRRAM